MSRSKHPRAKASTEALRRFKSLLPGLLSQVAMHGVAHVKLIREYREDGQSATVCVIDTTAEHLPDRGHNPDPKRIDHAMLREVQE